MTTDEMKMQSVGGRPIAQGSDIVWDFGFREDREWFEALPDYDMSGKSPFRDEDRLDWGDLWAHPQTIDALGGKPFLCTHQFTGSCVGAGGGNLMMTRICIEVIALGEPEKIFVPFWPLTYGRSRYHGGMKGKGDGSFEGAWCDAILKDGIIPADTAGLPPFKWGDGMEYSSGIEREWSDGARIKEEYLTESRKHLIKKAWRARSSADVFHAISCYRPVGWCGNWGGLMKCPLQGNPQVNLNRKSGSWSHKETALGRWKHPDLGNIYKIYNQWGLEVHGTDPNAKSGGGYWIKENEMEWQVKNGECVIYEMFDGVPAPTPDFINWIF